jgi:hypothetical protein
MAFTVYQIFLVGLMVITGTLNTLSIKWANLYLLIDLILYLKFVLLDKKLVFVIDQKMQQDLSIHSFK